MSREINNIIFFSHPDYNEKFINHHSDDGAIFIYHYPDTEKYLYFLIQITKKSLNLLIWMNITFNAVLGEERAVPTSLQGRGATLSEVG